ncbi:glycosyltransferase family 87 protein [Myxococcus stipitatus]|uniref:glycosyltransferase family 87 protein n=1 Tax=Myxococcus stipitatus TaxID=83455 RepID=UPI001F47EBED|nr:glycosyltransferase family 87 protein [Myxococcus stipitatus]
MTSKWARWLWWLVLAVLLVAAVAVGQHPRRGVDFRVYLTAAERFLEGTDLYRVSDGTMPFKYAPITAPLFLPFTVLPARLAVALWNVGSILALVAVARLTRREQHGPGEASSWDWGPPLATIALLPAFTFELFYGQVDVVMLLLVVVAALGAERGQVWRPGAAFAIAFLLKPPAALVGLFFLWRRHWRVIGATAAFGLLLSLPTLARYGWDGTLTQLHLWSETLARTTPPWVLAGNAQGLPSLLLSLFYPSDVTPPSSAITLAQAAAIALFLVAVVWARPGPADLLAVCCLGVTLLSPLAWRANFVLAWPLARAMTEGRYRPNLALVGMIAVVGALVSDTGLGEWSRSVLLARPFTLAYGALLIAALWQVKRAGAPRAVTPGGVLARLPRALRGMRAS